MIRCMCKNKMYCKATRHTEKDNGTTRNYVCYVCGRRCTTHENIVGPFTESKDEQLEREEEQHRKAKEVVAKLKAAALKKRKLNTRMEVEEL